MGRHAVTTTPLMLPDGTGRRHRRAGGVIAMLLVGLVIVLVIAANVVPVPYVILGPGPATNVLGTAQIDGKTTPLITVSGHPTYPATGALDFTTVLVTGGPGRKVVPAQLLVAYLRGEEIYSVDDLYPPNSTAEQVKSEAQAEMTDSQQEATAVALRALGVPVTSHVVVGAVADGAPAAGVLKVGDRIEKIGGVPVHDIAGLRAEMLKVTAGSPASMVLLRGSATLDVSVPTAKGSAGRAVVGIIPALTFTFPFTVKIDAGNVGGPSAGMMFSLGIYDVLTDGSLTGGKRIAGTGTISDDGSVGPIGGIAQKMVGAKQSGAQFFLAPADNCDEVRGHVPDAMTVVKVATFADALSAVTAIGKGETGALAHC